VSSERRNAKFQKGSTNLDGGNLSSCSVDRAQKNFLTRFSLDLIIQLEVVNQHCIKRGSSPHGSSSGGGWRRGPRKESDPVRKVKSNQRGDIVTLHLWGNPRRKFARLTGANKRGAVVSYFKRPTRGGQAMSTTGRNEVEWRGLDL